MRENAKLVLRTQNLCWNIWFGKQWIEYELMLIEDKIQLHLPNEFNDLFSNPLRVPESENTVIVKEPGLR